MIKSVSLMFGVFTLGSSSFMMAGLLPYVSETIGHPISATSQGITAFAITYLVVAPTFSFLFSGLSTKSSIQIAIICFITGNIFTIYAGDLSLFLIGRICTAIGVAIFNPLCVCIAIQSTKDINRGKSLSLISGANSAGVVIGVPLAVHVANEISWQYSIGLATAMAAILLVVFSLQNFQFAILEPSPTKHRWKSLIDKNTSAVLVLTFLTATASLGLYSFITTIQTSKALDIRIILFVWAAGGFLGSSTVGFIIDKTQRPKLIMQGIVTGLALVFVMLPAINAYHQFGYILFFIWGALGWAMPTPQLHQLLNHAPDLRQFLSALNSSVIGLGSAAGTALGGLVFHVGFAADKLPYFAASLLISAVAIQFIINTKIQFRSPSLE